MEKTGINIIFIMTLNIKPIIVTYKFCLNKPIAFNVLPVSPFNPKGTIAKDKILSTPDASM